MEKKYINRDHFYNLVANIITRETDINYKKAKYQRRDSNGTYCWGLEVQFGEKVILEEVSFADSKWLDLNKAIELSEVLGKYYRSIKILKSKFLTKLFQLSKSKIEIAREMEFQLVNDIDSIIKLENEKKLKNASIEKIINSYNYHELVKKYKEVIGPINIEDFDNFRCDRKTIYEIIKSYLFKKYNENFEIVITQNNDVIEQYYDDFVGKDKVIVLNTATYEIINKRKQSIISETVADYLYLDRPIEIMYEKTTEDFEEKLANEDLLELNDSSIISGYGLFNLITSNFSSEPNLLILLRYIEKNKQKFNLNHLNEIINFMASFDIENVTENDIQFLNNFDIINSKSKVIKFIPRR